MIRKIGYASVRDVYARKRFGGHSTRSISTWQRLRRIFERHDDKAMRDRDQFIKYNQDGIFGPNEDEGLLSDERAFIRKWYIFCTLHEVFPTANGLDLPEFLTGATAAIERVHESIYSNQDVEETNSSWLKSVVSPALYTRIEEELHIIQKNTFELKQHDVLGCHVNDVYWDTEAKQLHIDVISTSFLRLQEKTSCDEPVVRSNTTSTWRFAANVSDPRHVEWYVQDIIHSNESDTFYPHKKPSA